MELLTKRELAERLKTSVSTIYRITHTGEIPVYYVGKSPRYALDEVVDALRRKEVQHGN